MRRFLLSSMTGYAPTGNANDRRGCWYFDIQAFADVSNILLNLKGVVSSCTIATEVTQPWFCKTGARLSVLANVELPHGVRDHQPAMPDFTA